MPESSQSESTGGKIILPVEELLQPHPDDPVGANPCPVGHPAHRIWEDATREALLESFRFQEEMLSRPSRSEAEHQNWFIELCVRKFQIWAKRNLSIVRVDADARAYEIWLESFLQGWLKIAQDKPWAASSREMVLSELKVQLRRASKYCAANAVESVIGYQRRARGKGCDPAINATESIRTNRGQQSLSSVQTATEATAGEVHLIAPSSRVSSPHPIHDAIAFWEGIADRYLMLNNSPESFNLTATLVKSVDLNGEARPSEWRVQGGSLQRWESLAYTAGEFLDENSADFKIRWLEELLKDADWPERQLRGPTGLPEWHRTIPSLAVVSERRCRTLAMEAREAATAKRRAALAARTVTAEPDYVAPSSERPEPGEGNPPDARAPAPPPMPDGMDQSEYLLFIKAWSAKALFNPHTPYTIADFRIEQQEERLAKLGLGASILADSRNILVRNVNAPRRQSTGQLATPDKRRKKKTSADDSLIGDVNGKQPSSRKESLRFRGSRQCDPSLWQYFDYKKTSKTSPYRELLVHNFVSLSIPAGSTPRDVAEHVAMAASIPIESVPDDLNQPVFPRGQVVFAFAGDQFDKIAHDYDNMRWWVSDLGLNMAIVRSLTQHAPMRSRTLSQQHLQSVC